jgi:hypothetical protein
MKVFKVYDHECPICEKMALFDHSTILRLEVQPDYRTVELGNLLSPENPHMEDALLAQCVERYACNPDYTLDLPVYVVMSGKKYLGHLVGEHTATDLQTKLEEIINGAQDKKSQDTLYN